MIELAILRFPYDSWGTPFQQLKQVVEEPSPQLPADRFSADFVDFTSQCLRKNSTERPTYTELMQHPFFTLHDSKDTDVASFVKTILGDWDRSCGPNWHTTATTAGGRNGTVPENTKQQKTKTSIARLNTCQTWQLCAGRKNHGPCACMSEHRLCVQTLKGFTVPSQKKQQQLQSFNLSFTSKLKTQSVLASGDESVLVVCWDFLPVAHEMYFPQKKVIRNVPRPHRRPVL